MYVDLSPKYLSANAGLQALGWETGHSGNGWSVHSKYMACPAKFQKYKANQLAVQADEFPLSKGLEVGIIGHAMLEVHYCTGRHDVISDLKDRLIAERVTPEYVLEACRVVKAYLSSVDPFEQTLATEMHLAAESGYTCRLDLVVKHEEGIWLVDHKLLGRFDRATDCWDHHGEILGQQMCWEDYMKIDDYPYKDVPFLGSIVNILGKQKTPQFKRIVVPYRPERVMEFRRAINGTFRLERLSEAMGMWEKFYTSCITPYGPCTYYEECWK